MVALSSTAGNSISNNNGGRGGSFSGLSSKATLGAGKLGQGGAGGNGGAGGTGGSGGAGGNGGNGSNGGIGSGGGIYLAAGALDTLNTTVAVNSAAGGSAGALGMPGQGGTAGNGGPGSLAGIGGTGDNGTLAEPGTNGAPGGDGAPGSQGSAGQVGTDATSGGGAIAVAGGAAMLENTTVALNAAGGGVSVTGGSVTAVSSLFAGNAPTDFQGDITASNSLFQIAPTGSVTGSANIIGANPLLATQGLTGNGGPTATIALQPGSPALDAGANPEEVLTDQRRAPRSDAGGVDIGAFQVGSAIDSTPPTASLQAATVDFSTASTQSPYTFTITYSDNLAVKLASLAGAVVQVDPPGAGTPIPATFESATPQGAKDSDGDAQSFVVTYQVVAPGGSWTEADDGTYQIVLVSGAPTDLAGNPLATGTIGSFKVAIFSGSLSVTSGPPGSVVAGAGFQLVVEAKNDQGQLITNFDEDVTLTVSKSRWPGHSFRHIDPDGGKRCGHFSGPVARASRNGLHDLAFNRGRSQLCYHERHPGYASAGQQSGHPDPAAIKLHRRHRLRSRCGRDRPFRQLGHQLHRSAHNRRRHWSERSTWRVNHRQRRRRGR